MAGSPVCRRCGVELTDSTVQGYCLSCLLREGLAQGGQKAEGGGQRTENKLATTDDLSPLAPRPSPPAPSFGDYELLEKVGEGGMGVVYRARQISLGRIVAIKLLPSGQFRRDEAVERFRTEASAAASLQHPNIVAIHEVGEHAGQPYFSMDYIEGQTLAEAVREQPLPAKRAAAYLRAIAEAVQYAHEHGILHRDLKPSNVLIDASDQPRVTDFGLAKRLAGDSDLTLTGQVLGSPNFMSPEQAEGRPQAVGPASDIYSLGALLYHLLTRQPPFQADTLTTLLKQVIEADPVPPRRLNPSIPRDLETVCLKCLEKEIGKRYATAHLLAEDLDRFLGGKPVLARQVGPAGKASRWARRNPRLASAVGVALLSLLIGVAGVFSQWHRAESERARAETGERFARQNTYAADMLLAQHALRDNNRTLAVSLLEKHRPATGGKSEILPQGGTKSETDLRGWEWRYLWRLCHGDEQFTLCKHPGSVSALAVSKNGKVLALRNGAEVALWDLATKQPLMELPSAASDALAFSPADTLLAVGSRDADGQWGINLWDVSTGRLTKTLKHRAEVRSVAVSPDGKLLATFDNRGNVAVTDLASGLNLTNLTVRPPRRTGAGVVAFSPDGSRLAVGEDHGGIHFLGLESGTFVQIQTEFTDGVTALAFAPGADVLAASFGGTIWLCNPRTGQALGKMTNHTEWVTGLAFIRGGRQLASASGDWTIRIWSVPDGSQLGCLLSSREGLAALALLPGGKMLVSGGSGGSVCFWDATAIRQRPLLHTNLVISAGFDAMSAAAPQAYAQGALDPRVIRRLGLAFTADSRNFIIPDLAGVLGLWQVQPLQHTQTLSALGSNHWGVALSPDDRWLAVGDSSGKVVIWDWPTRNGVTNLALPFEWFGGLRFSRSGNYLMAATVLNEIVVHTRIWRCGDWKEIPLSQHQSAGLRPVELSPNDRFLAAGYADGTVKLWTFPSGECQATLTNHTSGVYAIRFLPDGRMLVSTGGDGSVRLWDLAARRTVATLRGHFANAWGAALSADGRRLATGGGSSRDAVKLWDLETHRELLSLPAEGQFFTHVTFSPDEDTLAATSLSGEAHLWHVPSWEEIEAAENRRQAP